MHRGAARTRAGWLAHGEHSHATGEPRRVYALGCFYRVPQAEKVVVSAQCPKCGKDLPINLRCWRKGERSLDADLEKEGRRDLREVQIEVRRAQAFGGRAP